MKFIYIFMFLFLFIASSFYGQTQDDEYFCNNKFIEYVKSNKIPKAIKKIIKRDRSINNYLWYKQNNKFVKTYNINFYTSENNFIIRYFRSTSLYSQDVIVFFNYSKNIVKKYIIIGNKCMQKEDINSIIKCNCESGISIISEGDSASPALRSL